MMSHEVSTQVEAGILTVSFNRLDRKKSITTAMKAECSDL